MFNIDFRIDLPYNNLKNYRAIWDKFISVGEESSLEMRFFRHCTVLLGAHFHVMQNFGFAFELQIFTFGFEIEFNRKCLYD